MTGAGHKDVIKDAQAAWKEHFGSTRSSPKESRIDKGVQRQWMMSVKPTEVGWLRNRRRAVREAAKSSSATIVVDAAEPEGWTEGHSKELSFQDRKHLKKRVQCFQDQTLLPTEVDEDLQEHVAEHNAKRRKRDAERQRAEIRTDARTKGGKVNWGALAGKKAFVDAEVSDRDGLCGKLRERFGVNPAEKHSEADIFIVPDPAKLGGRIEWAAVLNGALVLTPKLQGGPAVQFDAAVSVKRHVFFTEGFRAKHQAAAQICRAIIASRRGANWKLINSHEAYKRKKDKACAASRRTTVLGLATNQEKEETPHRMCCVCSRLIDALLVMFC